MTTADPIIERLRNAADDEIQCAVIDAALWLESNRSLESGPWQDMVERLVAELGALLANRAQVDRGQIVWALGKSQSASALKAVLKCVEEATAQDEGLAYQAAVAWDNFRHEPRLVSLEEHQRLRIVLRGFAERSERIAELLS